MKVSPSCSSIPSGGTSASTLTECRSEDNTAEADRPGGAQKDARTINQNSVAL